MRSSARVLRVSHPWSSLMGLGFLHPRLQFFTVFFPVSAHLAEDLRETPKMKVTFADFLIFRSTNIARTLKLLTGHLCSFVELTEYLLKVTCKAYSLRHVQRNLEKGVREAVSPLASK